MIIRPGTMVEPQPESALGLVSRENHEPMDTAKDEQQSTYEYREGRRALDLLLGDHDRKQFFADQWEKRSVHLPHDDPQRFSHLISRESFHKHEISRCRHLKAMFRDPKQWVTEMEITADQVKRVIEAQMTVCATMLSYDSPCGDFIRDFRKSFNMAAQPHFNCYYSPEGKGYGLHFDTHPVWILQVEGHKRWQVGPEPAVVNPLMNISFPPDRDELKLPWITVQRPDMSSFLDVVLRPGDVLYIPAGTWHQAKAEEYSLALTLAQSRVSSVDLLFLYLQQMLPLSQQLLSRIHGIPLEEASAAGREVPESLKPILAEAVTSFQKMAMNLTENQLYLMYSALAQRPLDDSIPLMSPSDMARALKQQAG